MVFGAGQVLLSNKHTTGVAASAQDAGVPPSTAVYKHSPARPATATPAPKIKAAFAPLAAPISTALATPVLDEVMTTFPPPSSDATAPVSPASAVTASAAVVISTAKVTV